jgi:hypothetical protein
MMPYGQSNADHHVAGPAFQSDFLNDDRVVVPNDGHGFRGSQGRPTKRPITGFQTAYGRQMHTQSLALVAAVRFLKHRRDRDIDQVIIRSGAKGGRPLLGFEKNGVPIEGIYKDAFGDLSPVLGSFLQQARDIIAIAQRKNRPVARAFIPFLHGEADRASSRDAYATNLMAMMDVVDQAFDEMCVPTFWLLTQPSGTSSTHNGNAWPNRMAIQDVADARENAALVCANYGYSMIDASHLSAEGRVLVGELIGVQAAAIENGKFGRHVRPASVHAQGNMINVTFCGAPDLTIDQDRFPKPRLNFGFHVEGRAPDFVRHAEITDQGTLRLTCASDLPPNFKLNYAYASRTKKDPVEDTVYPFGRGCLREAWLGASLVLPGEQLLKWVPAFSISGCAEAA